MNDEYQVRADIEKLYDLIYARTTEEQSPVTQKDEFDEFKEEVANTYTTLESFDELSNSVVFKDVEWEVIYEDTTDDISILLEANWINVRLTVSASSISHTTSYVSKQTIAASYADYFPKNDLYAISEGVEYRFRIDSQDNIGYFEIMSRGSSSVTKDVNCTMYWAIDYVNPIVEEEEEEQENE